MNIRQATIADIELLIPLFDGYRKFYRQESDIDGARRFLKERINNRESVIYIAFAESIENPIGFTQLYPIFSSTTMERMLLLNDLFIDPEYRGKGVGKALIDTAKDLCRKTPQKGVVLQTEPTNPAQRLYEREGFTIDPDLHYFWPRD